MFAASIINIKISGDKNISSMIERRLKIYKNAPKKVEIKLPNIKKISLPKKS